MPLVTKRWRVLQHNRSAIEQFARELRIAPIAAQLLLNRGITTVEAGNRFLDAPLNGLHPPQALPGVAEAAAVLADAVAAKKRICVYGDYDVDGVTGTVILYRLLQLLGADVRFHVPHRINDGYGLSEETLKNLRQDGVEVVVTVDCGIANWHEAAVAKALGLELLITDHHEMKDRLPDARALVHPRLPGTSYPFPGLSGAGVAFKLAWATAVKATGSEKLEPRLRDFLLDAVCYAAIGLIADVMPILDENRILVRFGLKHLNKKPPMGLQSMFDLAKVGVDRPIRSEDIGFRLAPRMNAAGRLGCARWVVEMLTTADPAKARQIAESLEGHNADRQTIERRITLQAKEMIAEQYCYDDPAFVLAHPSWHPGVIGIVASRLTETFGRPTILFALRDGSDEATGSGRSIPGFALHEALHACNTHLLGYGGHAMAAGVRIRPLNIPKFRDQFLAYVARHFPSGAPPAPEIVIDAEVPLSAMTLGLVADLELLEPYGAENPRPRFLASGLTIVGDPRRIGGGDRHLNFRVSQGRTTLRAIAWGMGDRLEELLAGGGQVSLVFTPKINEWQGYRNVELEVSDFQAGSETVLD